jgi:hypothetical protein
MAAIQQNLLMAQSSTCIQAAQPLLWMAGVAATAPPPPPLALTGWIHDIFALSSFLSSLTRNLHLDHRPDASAADNDITIERL